MTSSQYDLLGSLLPSRSGPTFQATKSSGGIAIATPRDETRAGITVIAGKGVRTVGMLAMSSPTDAGINSPQPPMSVAIPLFKSPSVSAGHFSPKPPGVVGWYPGEASPALKAGADISKIANVFETQ
jgi:hypothetical protein